MVVDLSKAKSQFLHYILSILLNAINTTGRGSTSVCLTAAVVVNRDTGDRHLEARVVILGDRGYFYLIPLFLFFTNKIIFIYFFFFFIIFFFF